MIVWRAIVRLTGRTHPHVDARWYAFVVIGVVIAIDVSRTVASGRAARRYSSAAFSSNALHFASDLAGSAAVLVGLLLVRAGYPKADAIAALFVACSCSLAAVRLMRGERRRADGPRARRRGGGGARARSPASRRRSSCAACACGRRRGRHFADVVIGVAARRGRRPGPRRGRRGRGGACSRRCPEADVVVHVEPREDDGDLRERAHAAALGVPRVREMHNVSVLAVGAGTELSLHLKLPGDLSLEEAHEIAEQVERAIHAAVPEVDAVQTHLEPLAEETRHGREEVADDHDVVERIVRDDDRLAAARAPLPPHGRGPRRLPDARLEPGTPLAEAHAQASQIEEADPARASRDRRRDRPHGAAGMRLCMFSPKDLELERGWPGRIDGDRVVQLAAQTLQAFFTGGGGAREHAVFALEDVVLARARAATGRRSHLRRRRLRVRQPCVRSTAPTRPSSCRRASIGSRRSFGSRR